jgi:hypothetical protein
MDIASYALKVVDAGWTSVAVAPALFRLSGDITVGTSSFEQSITRIFICVR